MMKVESLMKTRLHTAKPQDTVRDALKTMSDAEVHHLPVVDHGRLVGIVSQRDLLRALDMSQATDGGRQQPRIGDIMQTEVLHVSPRTAAQEAVSMMIESKIGALPVVGDDGKLIGILSGTDFLELAREALLGVDGEQRARG
jgi:CBS domain-containing protein